MRELKNLKNKPQLPDLSSLIIRSSDRLRGIKAPALDLPNILRSVGGFFGRARSMKDTNKTAALYYSGAEIKPLSPIRNIANSRPIVKLGTPQKQSKFPNSVITPAGTKLDKRTDTGFMAIYEEKEARSNAENIATSANQVSRRARKKLDFKDMSYKVDLYNQEKKSKNLSKRRDKSQKAIMGDSAQNILIKAQKNKRCLDFPKDSVMEWSHLVAHYFLGSKAQNWANIVATTKVANSNMWLHAESHIKKLAQNGPVTISVVADVEERSDIATNVRYKIKQNGHEAILNFKTSDMQQPSMVDRKWAEKALDFAFTKKGPFKDKITQNALARNNINAITTRQSSMQNRNAAGSIR